MRIVLDTNVLVSGLISPGGSPGTIISMISNERLRVAYDPRILAEYREVLQRPEFHLPSDRIDQILAEIIASGERVLAATLHPPLQDKNDMPFLEVALTARVECLVTGNLKHFPLSCRQGALVFSPAEFLQYYRKVQDSSSGVVKSSSEEYRSSKQAENKKIKKKSSDAAVPRPFTEFTRRIDSTRSAGDVDWTPEEVEKVILSMRRKKACGRRRTVG